MVPTPWVHILIPKGQLPFNLRHFLAQDPDFPPAESPKLEEAISYRLCLCPREYKIKFHKAKRLPAGGV